MRRRAPRGWRVAAAVPASLALWAAAFWALSPRAAEGATCPPDFRPGAPHPDVGPWGCETGETVRIYEPMRGGKSGGGDVLAPAGALGPLALPALPPAAPPGAPPPWAGPCSWDFQTFRPGPPRCIPPANPPAPAAAAAVSLPPAGLLLAPLALLAWRWRK